MKAVLLRFVAVAALGASTPLWWPAVSAHLVTAGYSFAGAPEKVLIPELAWTIVAVSQVLIGAAVGSVASVLPFLRAWLTFHIFLLAGAFVLGDLSAPFQAMKNVGGWSFEAGLMLGLSVCRPSGRGTPRMFRRRSGDEARAS